MPSELRTYYPSARERTEQSLRDLFAGDRRPSAVQASQVRGIMDVLDFTPAGLVFGLDDAQRMTRAGIANASPWQIAGGVGLAALAASPFLRKALKGPIMRAAYNRRFFDPPKKPARPYEADYPEAVPADAQGRLLVDIEGRPLTARRVVGRNVVGGRDEAFPAEEYDALSKATTRFGTTTVSPRYMDDVSGLKNALGVTFRDESGPVSIALRSGLSKGEHRRTHGHELGHVVDELNGQLHAEDVSQELEGVFNTQNNPARTFRGGEADDFFRPVTPEDFGYEGEAVTREYWAEAIRAYLYDPNYIKTVAPRVAAAIRAAVNANPKLNKIIQFNSAIAPVAGGDVLSAPDGENEGARKKIPKSARVDPSDPGASDSLPIEAWMKRRREQLGKPQR